MILTLIRIKNTNHQFFVSTYLKPLDGMNNLFNPIIYTKQSDDEDIASIFISKLTPLTNKIYNDYYKRPKQLKLTTQEQEEFDKIEICHICSKEFYEEHRTCKIREVRDHCHFTGKYRGAAHNSCNLQCRKPLILPVIFHNLQGYDGHLFIEQLSKVKGELTCIPSAGEKYIFFQRKLKLMSLNIEKQVKT